MAIIKGFTFDGISSIDYGIAITEDGTYSAPQRDVQMVEIPGRNGSYIIDNDRYSNIEVTYHCVIGNDDQESFNDKVMAFRNEMLSRVGYKRLSDDFHPDEYRLASCVNGIDFVNTPRTAGEFDVVFTCKPQRYLVSGEAPVSIASGSKLVNPTYFDARPLIIVNASDDGVLYVNSETIGYLPESIGKMELDNTRSTVRESETSGTLWTQTDSTWTTSRYNSGDAIGTDGEITFRVTVTFPGYVGYRGDVGTNISIRGVSEDTTNQRITFSLAVPKNVFKFNAGTEKTISPWFTSIIQYEEDQSSGVLETSLTFTLRISHSASENKTITIEAYGAVPTGAIELMYQLDNIPVFYVNSTRAAFDGDVYFDTEACEAYIYGDDDEIISINGVVVTGYDYPKLVPGENGISFYGGINSCKIIPRWWTI